MRPFASAARLAIGRGEPRRPQVDATHPRSYAGPSGCAPEAEEHELQERGSVTASEFSFLALGLILGLVTGAALVELFRARPPAPHEVRLTVSHDAIRRRPSTLAEDAFVSVGPNRPAAARPTAAWPGRRATRSPRRPNVERTCGMNGHPRVVGAAVDGGRDPDRAGTAAWRPPCPGRTMEPSMPLTGVPPGRDSGPEAQLVGIPISGGDDPILGALRRRRHAGRGAARVGRRAGTCPRPATRHCTAPATATATAAAAGRGHHRGRACSNGPCRSDHPAWPFRCPSSDPAATDRCAEERRLADERCELATRVRAQAVAAADALRLAQRSYDEHEAAAVTAAWQADPRAVHDAKDAAQGGFRSAVAAATSSDQLEAAARDWLTEINRINTEAREARTTADPRARGGERDRCDPRAPRARGRLGPDLGRQCRRDLPRRPRGRRRMRRAPGRGSGELPRPARRGAGRAAPPRRRRDAQPGARRRRRAPHLPAPARRPAGDDQPGRGARRQVGPGRQAALATPADEPGRGHRGRRHRGVGPRLPDRPRILGRVHRGARAATSPTRCRRSATGSTVSAAGRMGATRRSATCRWPSATRASTRCASAIGRRRKPPPSCSGT